MSRNSAAAKGTGPKEDRDTVTKKFLVAARNNDLTEVKRILKLHPSEYDIQGKNNDSFGRNNKGLTALHLAADNDHRY